MDGGAAHLGIRLLGEVVACRLVEIDGDVTSTIDRRRVATGCESGEGAMCGDGEDPTINTAAKWLNKPQNQEMLFSLQAKLKK